MSDYQPPTHDQVNDMLYKAMVAVSDHPLSDQLLVLFRELLHWQYRGCPIADMRQVEPCDHITVLNSDRGFLSVTDEGLDCCPKCSGTGYVVVPHKREEIFSENVQLRLSDLPRWKPEIILPPQALEDTDD